jgi:hypothetical protein
MPFLQIGNGKQRVRIVVPPELRPYLPPPHTGKANLTRALGIGNERKANRLVVPWIAAFLAAITSAASITENTHGYIGSRAIAPTTVASALLGDRNRSGSNITYEGLAIPAGC